MHIPCTAGTGKIFAWPLLTVARLVGVHFEPFAGSEKFGGSGHGEAPMAAMTTAPSVQEAAFCSVHVHTQAAAAVGADTTSDDAT